MIAVLATREGLIGGRTASGYIVDATVPFVALPSTLALRQRVRVFNPKNGKECIAVVLDVGPWNVGDHTYVFQTDTLEKQPWIMPTGTIPKGIRPQAETGTDLYGRPTNKAGIDLGEAVWKALGMTDNSEVWWEFD